MKYSCELCGFIYDEEVGDVKRGILPGTAFETLPGYFECPGCGYEKESFSPLRSIHTGTLFTQSHARPTVRK